MREKSCSHRNGLAQLVSTSWGSSSHQTQIGDGSTYNSSKDYTIWHDIWLEEVPQINEETRTRGERAACDDGKNRLQISSPKKEFSMFHPKIQTTSRWSPKLEQKSKGAWILRCREFPEMNARWNPALRRYSTRNQKLWKAHGPHLRNEKDKRPISTTVWCISTSFQNLRWSSQMPKSQSANHGTS